MQNQTGLLYLSAIDVENSGNTYVETNTKPADRPEESESENENEATIEDYEQALRSLGVAI